MVVASAPGPLAAIAEGRTRVVLDDHLAPTASFVKDTTIDLRESAMRQKLAKAAGKAGLSSVHATDLAAALFGDAIAANMLLVGHAWQKGLLPISRAAIEAAIELNGAGVALNRAAFAWGRLSALDPDKVNRSAGLTDVEEEVPALDDIVARRAQFLTGYQNAAYAERYRQLVGTAREAETRIAGTPGPFTEAVARSAFKLMAYKDEYEVARLHRDPAFRRRIAGQFEGGYRLKYHLAPPLLARTDHRTGQPGKIAFRAAWIEPVFAVLARLKGLRGTAFDPFGRTRERRTERQLIADYFAAIGDIAARLDQDRLHLATELAALPEQVRGFGHVKMAAIGRYEARRKELLAALGSKAAAKQAA